MNETGKGIRNGMIAALLGAVLGLILVCLIVGCSNDANQGQHVYRYHIDLVPSFVRDCTDAYTWDGNRLEYVNEQGHKITVLLGAGLRVDIEEKPCYGNTPGHLLG